MHSQTCFKWPLQGSSEVTINPKLAKHNQVPYTNSLDPDEMPSNLASYVVQSVWHSDNIEHRWSTLKMEADEKFSRQFIWWAKG